MNYQFYNMKWVIWSQWAMRLVSFKYDNERRNFVTNWMEVLYTVVVAGLLAGFSGYFSYEHFVKNSIIGQDLSSTSDRTQYSRFLVATVEFTSTIIFGIYFMLNSIPKRHRHVKFMDNMKNVDELLKKSFNINVNQSWLCKLYFFLLFVITAFFCMSLWMMYKIVAKDKVKEHVFLAIYIILAIVTTLLTLSFVYFVTAVYLRTVHLKCQLMDTLKIPPEILQDIFKTKNKMCLEVMKYTKIHRILNATVGDLNEIYGFPLVLNFAHDFVVMTSLIFMMFYLSFYDGFEASKRNIIYYIVWMFPNIFRISLSCLACHLTKNELSACSRYLRKFSYEADEDDVTDVIDMFALQTIHLNTEFTANNFFSIDMSLFYKIISACTTYLVILIQFKNYDDEAGDDNGVLKGNVTNSSSA